MALEGDHAIRYEGKTKNNKADICNDLMTQILELYSASYWSFVDITRRLLRWWPDKKGSHKENLIKMKILLQCLARLWR